MCWLCYRGHRQWPVLNCKFHQNTKVDPRAVVLHSFFQNFEIYLYNLNHFLLNTEYFYSWHFLSWRVTWEVGKINMCGRCKGYWFVEAIFKKPSWWWLIISYGEENTHGLLIFIIIFIYFYGHKHFLQYSNKTNLDLCCRTMGFYNNKNKHQTLPNIPVQSPLNHS